MNNRIRSLLSTVDAWLPDRISGLVGRFVDSRILLSASSLAFYGLVSALPLLLITFALVAAMTGDGTVQRFVDQVSQSGPEGTGQFLSQLADGSGALTFTTLVFTAWPATAYGVGLRRALSRYSDRSESASGLRGRAMGLSMVLILPFIVLAGIPLMFFLTTLSGEGALATALGWTLAFVSGTGVAAAVATVLYLVFTPGELGIRQVLGGGILTGLLTALFSMAFVLYLQVGETEESFGGGTIAVVVLLGIWLFVANIVLIGGFETVLKLEGVLDAEE